MMQSNIQLDVKGLACPMPIVKTKKMMNTMNMGEVLEVSATDKGSLNDFTAWAKVNGHTMLAQKEEADVFYFYIQKG